MKGMILMMYGNNYGYGMMGGFGLSGWLGYILIFIFMVLIGYALYKLFDGKHNSESYKDSMEELKIRFVKGEISEEEYRTRKKLIQDK